MAAVTAGEFADRVDTADESTKGTGNHGERTYEQTLMYGKYTDDLGAYARRVSRSAAPTISTSAARPISQRIKFQQKRHWSRKFDWCYFVILRRIGEDWVFLTTLGVTMALLSYVMDLGIEKIHDGYAWAIEELVDYVFLQYLAWVVYPLVFICFSTGFVHLVGPNAIGSGIPEMKTILRGVELKEYLTFRTLISKMVGLTTSLGSGLPIGKEGPFVHVASITSTLLGKVIGQFRGIYENESRNTEMLAAACAVGVACTFAAPIGGVLFSIEVTATYFAVRNYWRGFYAAVCGAFTFRLIAILNNKEETITALFKTSIRQDLPFDPWELLVFSFIGVACGFGGPLFVFTHRKIVEFMRNQKKLSAFLQKNRFIFPSVVVFILSSLCFPRGFGQYTACHLTMRKALNLFFDNTTWHSFDGLGNEGAQIFRGPADNVYLTITLFIIMKFWMSALAITLPVPSGVFMPVFTIGAAFGRLVGEAMAAWFPDGIQGHSVIPAGYALVGAAAFSGSVTHTISTSVIVFEVTGHMGHGLPCVIAVLISNAIAHYLHLSIYDSLIRIKKLPYLPDIINQSARRTAFATNVEDFMNRHVHFITLNSSYRSVINMVQKYKLRDYPIVDSSDSMILLGAIPNIELEKMILKHLDEQEEVDPVCDSGSDNDDEDEDGRHADEQSLRQNLPQIDEMDELDHPIMHSERLSSNTDDTLKAAPSLAKDVGQAVKEGEEQAKEREGEQMVRKKKFSVVKIDEPKPKPDSTTVDVNLESAEKRVRKDSSVSRKDSILNRGRKRLRSDSEASISGNFTRGPSLRQSWRRRVSHLFRVTERDDVDAVSPLNEQEMQRWQVTLRDIDFSDLNEWENNHLAKPLNFEGCSIDPAPFQLVEKSSLYKVHSIFSLLNLHHAYVVNTGRLVGIVSVRELRDAVQGQITSYTWQKQKEKEHVEQERLQAKTHQKSIDETEA